MNEQSSDRQLMTPSWKVNLSEKFNMFSQKKNIEKQGILLSFEKQLEERLKEIPSKQQLSGSKAQKKQSVFKKQSRFQIKNKELYLLNQPITAKLKMPTNIANSLSSRTNEKDQQRQLLDISQINIESSPKKLLFQIKNQQRQSQSSKRSDFVSYFTDYTTSKLFQEYFHQRKNIQLVELIDACCVQFFKEDKISSEIREILVKQCRAHFCTTDQNSISLNAVELLTKKVNLKHFIYEKLLKAKYTKRKLTLQKQYQQILEEIVQQQQMIKHQNEKLDKRQKNAQLHERQLTKKQKALKAQQKEITQKQKQMKKVLQDRANKLTAQMLSQAQKCFKEIQKKASTFQRNARNKAELIQKRANDYKYAVNKQIPEKDTEENTSRKIHNQILLLKNKLRKLQKQYQSYIQQTSKQLKNSQLQSTALLKANAILQAKIQKLKARQKQTSQALQLKQKQLEGLNREKFQDQHKIKLLQEDLKEFQQKIAALSNLQLKNKRYDEEGLKRRLQFEQKPDANKKPTKIKSSRSVSRKHPNQHKPGRQEKQDAHKSTISFCDNCQLLLGMINSILMNMTKSFDNKHNLLSSKQINIHSKQQTIQPKIEQVLINQAQTIFNDCLQIFWVSIQIEYIKIQAITSFMIKLFLAKFSLIKFQSLNCNVNQDLNSSSIQNFIEQIQISAFDNRSVDTMFKYCSAYAQNFPQKPSIQRFNLYFIFSVAGLDEIYSFRKNKSISTLQLIKEALMADIQQQSSKIIVNKRIIHKFYEQELMTYLFNKFLVYSTNIHQAFIFVQILLEICNLYMSEDSDQIPLFKTIFALDNYKNMFNFIIINFNEENLQKDIKLREIFQNISIILQRFCYKYHDKIILNKCDITQVRKILIKLKANKNTQGSLFQANIQSIVSLIDNSQEQQEI